MVAVAALALAGTASAQPDLTGSWSGYWLSDTNGHTGPLRAKFTQINPEQYRVVYSGRFAKVIPFRYVAKMDVVVTGGEVVVLTAEKPLGPFGTFRTTAYSTNSNFDATFNSRRDNGKFVLRR
jgi:hypothetical protein